MTETFYLNLLLFVSAAERDTDWGTLHVALSGRPAACESGAPDASAPAAASVLGGGAPRQQSAAPAPPVISQSSAARKDLMLVEC